MNLTEFEQKLADLIREALDSDMSPQEFLGAISFQVFALYLARAHANADEAERKQKGK